MRKDRSALPRALGPVTLDVLAVLAILRVDVVLATPATALETVLVPVSSFGLDKAPLRFILSDIDVSRTTVGEHVNMPADIPGVVRAPDSLVRDLRDIRLNAVAALHVRWHSDVLLRGGRFAPKNRLGAVPAR